MAGLVFSDVKRDDRGDQHAAIVRVGGSGAGAVDDLELGELRKPFLGEFGADARMLGAAERDMRRHVEVLVDPDGTRLDPACDLVGARRTSFPSMRRLKSIIGFALPVNRPL
jgi:hypothetical protein